MDEREDDMQAWANEQELEHQYFEEVESKSCQKDIQILGLPKDTLKQVKKNVTHVMKRQVFR